MSYCLWEFHQIYNLGAVGDREELVRFWGQNITARPIMVKNHVLKNASFQWGRVCQQFTVKDHPVWIWFKPTDNFLKNKASLLCYVFLTPRSMYVYIWFEQMIGWLCNPQQTWLVSAAVRCLCHTVCTTFCSSWKWLQVKCTVWAVNVCWVMTVIASYKKKVQIYASEQQCKMFACSNLHFADTISKMWTSLKR